MSTTIAKGRIRIPVSAGELIDKICILRIKADRMTDPDRLRHVREELRLLEEVYLDVITLHTDPGPLLEQLSTVNEQLWEAENRIRECGRRGDFGPEFVALACSILRLNSIRAQYKRELSLRLDSELVEQKEYSAGPPAPDPIDPGA